MNGDAETGRLWSRLSDHENRIRQVESSNPSRTAADLIELQHSVSKMNIEGTKITQDRLTRIERDVDAIRGSVERLEQTELERLKGEASAQRSARIRTVGIIAAAAATVVANLLIQVLSAPRPGG